MVSRFVLCLWSRKHDAVAAIKVACPSLPTHHIRISMLRVRRVGGRSRVSCTSISLQISSQQSIQFRGALKIRFCSFKLHQITGNVLSTSFFDSVLLATLSSILLFFLQRLFWDWSRDVVRVNNQPGSLLVFFGFLRRTRAWNSFFLKTGPPRVICFLFCLMCRIVNREETLSDLQSDYNHHQQHQLSAASRPHKSQYVFHERQHDYEEPRRRHEDQCMEEEHGRCVWKCKSRRQLQFCRRRYWTITLQTTSAYQPQRQQFFWWHWTITLQTTSDRPNFCITSPETCQEQGRSLAEYFWSLEIQTVIARHSV